MAGHHAEAYLHRPVGAEPDSGDTLQEAAVDLLADRQHDCIGLQGLQLPGG
jgi:hypothetical protein